MTSAVSWTALQFLALIALLGGCVGFPEIDISQVNVNDIQSQLPPELANSNFTLDNARTLLRDKCVEVAGEENGTEAFQDIESATQALADCVQGIVNYTAIQAEIKEASPNGELDVVFNKYCKKRPMAIECIESFSAKLEPCLEPEERDNQKIFMRIVKSLLNFICHKGGDQIALFIAEKGPECLESKKDDIQQCLNSTFSSYVPKEGLENVKSLPKFVMGPKQCDDMQHLETCIVEKLELCSEITPANIVESMFRFIKNETICRTSKTTKSGKNIASLAGLNGVALALMAVLSVLLGKWLNA